MRSAALGLILGVGVIAVSSAPEAEPAGKRLPRVALVCVACPTTEMMFGPEPANPHYRAFVHALRDLGWRNGT